MYQLTNTTAILRTTDDAFIPTDGANTDYQQYLQWISEGNEPQLPAAPQLVIPSVVTMRQARLALLQAGVLPLVESAITSMESPAAQIEWDYSQEVNREQPLVKQLAEALNLTSDQLDNLFLEASKL